MILGEAILTGYQLAEDNSWVSAKNIVELEEVITEKETGKAVVSVSLEAEQVEKKGSDFILKEDPSIVIVSRAHKMSKSVGNVINPDTVVEAYGADSLRLYEMFMGPLEQTKPWNMSGVEGVYRFLGRVWRMIVDEKNDEHVVLHPAVQDVEPSADQLRVLHKTIKAVSEDIEKLSFNTAISRMMEFANSMSGSKVLPVSVMKDFVLLLSPFAPHIAEELWALLGGEDTLAFVAWPQYDESKMIESEIEIPVQVNGKLRAKIRIAVDADQKMMEQAARDDENIKSYLDGKQVVKVICVPKRMVNFVVKG